MIQTLGMIKPSALERGALPFTLQMCEAAGLAVNNVITLNLSRDFLEGFYAEHRERPYFEKLVSAGMEGSSCILLLESLDGMTDAVGRWRALIGPTDPFKARFEAPSTLRGLFGGRASKHGIVYEMPYNGFHGSDSDESYTHERRAVHNFLATGGWG